MDQDPTANLPCNLCGNRQVAVLSQRSRSGRPMRTVACRDCGLAWTDPRPHEVRSYYESDYRLDYKGSFEPKPKHVLRAGRVALSRLSRIAHCLRAGSRVLDVGSGGGEFAYLLARGGHSVTGVEPNRGYADYARREYGLTILPGFIQDAPIADAAFDLVTIWHVLEHTEDPGAVLRRLAAALAPDGRLVVEVPNIEATCQSPANRFHEAHLVSFNAATLTGMAARAGLRLVQLQVSEDGGNLTAILMRGGDASDSACVPVAAGNFDRIRSIVSGHTAWRHWTSAAPYRRAFKRWGGFVDEHRRLPEAASGRELLDRLYAEPSPALAPPPRGRPGWRAVLAAYGFALFAEWVLTDHYGPALGWSESGALLGYLALQTGVLAGLLFMVRRRRGSLPQALAIGGLMLPVFTLPAVC